MSGSTVFILIIVLVLGVGVWWYQDVFFGGAVIIAPPEPVIGGGTLELVEKLRAVEIDTAFFSDPAFLELEPAPDFIFESFQKGRNNPFAQIEAPIEE